MLCGLYSGGTGRYIVGEVLRLAGAGAPTERRNMNRTLHAYISRDLLKVTALALVAFTLVMTVFAIIEPLRKRGLASGQVASLFVYTLPMMLSLTVPIAALFAGTIVYGRFSQDNELMACRASGISTISLLKPALVLGATVMVISMVLSNYVAPKMTELLAISVKANAMGIVARRLRTQNYIKKHKTDSRGRVRTQIIHADAVIQKGNKLILLGVVAAEGKDPRRMRVLAAPKAYAQFTTGDDKTYVAVHLENPVVMQRGGRRIGRAQSQPLFLPVPNPAQEKPSWYNWNKLLRARREPAVNSEIRGIMKAMRREMYHDMFHGDVVEALRSKRPYDKLRDSQNVYVIRAAGAKRSPDGSAMLTSDLEADGTRVPVEVTVLRDGRTHQVATADSGIVWARGNLLSGESLAAIELTGSVRVVNPGESPSDVTRPPKWSVGTLAIPPHVLQRGQKVTPADTIEGKPILGRGLALLPKLKVRIAKLKAKICGEIHSRLAFGLSCFLLVGIGAALGLIFKGGQVISAFAISMVPGSVVIVMIIMGKKMVTNPDVDQAQGIAVIWGGIVGLLLAELIVYVRLSRK